MLTRFLRLDINECNEQTHNCNLDAGCINTQGSFRCGCNRGYTGDGITCVGKSDSVVCAWTSGGTMYYWCIVLEESLLTGCLVGNP